MKSSYWCIQRAIPNDEASATLQNKMVCEPTELSASLLLLETAGVSPSFLSPPPDLTNNKGGFLDEKQYPLSVRSGMPRVLGFEASPSSRGDKPVPDGTGRKGKPT